jgi:hypothetical protein
MRNLFTQALLPHSDLVPLDLARSSLSLSLSAVHSSSSSSLNLHFSEKDSSKKETDYIIWTYVQKPLFCKEAKELPLQLPRRLY